MANQATLSDVIERLRAEGQLTRNTGTNSIKTVRVELSSQTTALQEMLKIMQTQEERAKLGRAGQDSGGGGPADPSPDPVPPTPPSDTNPILDALSALGALGSTLGVLAQAAAVAIGGGLGVIIGQFNTIKVFFPKTVDNIVKTFSDFTDNLRARFAALSTSITTKLTQTGVALRNAITFVEGVFSTAAARINQLGTVGKLFTSSISGIYNGIKNMVNAFLNVGKMMGNAIRAGASIGSAFSSIMAPLSSFIGAIKSVAGVVGKLFVPLGIIITAFDTIRGIIDGYTEGGILGALEGGITGFFNSLVFGPLDLLKNLVSWIAGKLGFENFASILDSFSFSELFSSLIGSIFDGVSSAFSVITDLFSFGEEDMTALGLLGKLTDLVYAPVNMAINFVAGIFGWEPEDGESFKLQDLITSTLDSVVAWFGELFDFLPSIEDMKQTLLSILPEWMQPDSIEEQRQNLAQEIAEQRQLVAEGDMYNWRGKNREEIISEMEEELASLPQFNKGSNGFRDFGPGSLAMLHGIEAVVPRNTPAGEFLANNFDENFNPIMQRIASVETAAMQQSQSPTIVVNAPTVAPVNNNVTGPTSVSNNRVTAIGAGTAGIGLGRFAN
jgi:hypothetical protein